MADESIDILQLLPWIPLVIIITALVTFPLFYMRASSRTNPGHKHYVPPEKLVWKVFTRGDIWSWIYAVLWVPVFFLAGIYIADPVIYAYLSNPYASREELKMPVIIYVLLFAGPVGAELIRIYINKKY